MAAVSKEEQSFIPLLEIPKRYAAELGQIAPLWTYQYWLFIRLASYLMSCSEKHARVMFREPRIEDYTNAIQDLLHLAQLKKRPALSSLGNKLRACEEQRNLYTHGLWLQDAYSNQLYVRYTKGNWDSNEQIKRKITPEPIEVELVDLKELRFDIQYCIHRTKHLTKLIGIEFETLQRKRGK